MTPIDLTINEMLRQYFESAKVYYRTATREWSELENLRIASRPLASLFGHELVSQFGPKKLKAVRQALIDGYTEPNGPHRPGISRKQINARINRIKRIFRWAVSEELVSPTLMVALGTLDGLRAGHTSAIDLPPVKPISLETVVATLPLLPPVVADMVRIQLLTAARPGEICIMRPIDIKRTNAVWEYTPTRHKGQWRTRGRVIFIGPEAQKILEPYLCRAATRYCFSPAESEINRMARLRIARKTRVQPSQTDRSKPDPQHPPGSRYIRMAYAGAIYRACRRNGIARWTPNQLRHAAATKIREQFGLEAAQVMLGHASADVTQIYAERNLKLGIEVAKKIG